MRASRHTALIAAAALGLMVSACQQSEAEREVKDQADAIEESYDAEADLQESLAQSAPDEAAVKAEADKLREQGDAERKHLDNMAEELRETQ
ncbi:hypothetical protein GRI97_02190 [Altererythrobacter xixiisoli]|uniref:Lipoprotein n=1 Tax=Croceibacterium xixiisoli TaxID=1476466 RepID=A0A6I4TS89_9SPHN|nr:hypothetical protein [Croceibacterium xixiisoli]MXO97797.1 hypothetical protein [Croceibacterium xixiisoli]